MATSDKWSSSTDEVEKRIINEVENLHLKEEQVVGRGRGRGITPASPLHSENGSVGLPIVAPGGPSPLTSGGGGDENVSSPEEDVTVAEKSLLTKILRTTLVTSKNDVEIQRSDPNSPLYSVTSFEELKLRPELLKGVYSMGFNKPSKIQESTLPFILSQPPVNVIAQSQSGTGKTAAFAITMINCVDTSRPGPQALCLSPTFELARQTGEVIQKMAKYCTDVTMRYVVRGEEFRRGEKISEHIIIGTPGKVMDWITKFRVLDVRDVRVFVLDEADVMIAMQGHQDQSLRIHKTLPQTCQMLLFSATYDEEVMNFASKVIKDPMIFRLRRDEESLDNIKQYYIKCASKEEKYNAILNIYGVITVGQAIIFCHTRQTVLWLTEKMVKDHHTVGMLTGELTTEQRIAVLDRFRKGEEKVLITTNVLSRGIDIEQVTLVINYDLPVDLKNRADCETYLHRIGRTGRFGKSGIAINLVDGQQSMNVLREIEQHFNRKIELLDAHDADEIEKLNQ